MYEKRWRQVGKGFAIVGKRMEQRWKNDGNNQYIPCFFMWIFAPRVDPIIAIYSYT